MTTVTYHYLGDFDENNKRILQSVPARVLRDHGDGLLDLDIQWPDALIIDVGDGMLAHKEHLFQKIQTEVPKATTTPPESGSWTAIARN